MSGKLFFCPTPIGNLKDISLRVLEVLSTVDVIAAEDTRHTLQLLNHYDIKKKLISYHEHNKLVSGTNILNLLNDGKDIALVTDAGMPGISDPGSDLIKLAIENNIDFYVLPGPTAFVNALVLSGLDTSEFYFIGFLDRNKKKRKEKLELVKDFKSTLIIYEAPHRIKVCLKDLMEVLGNRQIAIAREITKKFEEVLRGPVSEILETISDRELKGEIVVIIDGNKEIVKSNHFDEITIKDHVILKINMGSTKKEAIKIVALERKIPKKIVYKESIDI